LEHDLLTYILTLKLTAWIKLSNAGTIGYRSPICYLCYLQYIKIWNIFCFLVITHWSACRQYWLSSSKSILKQVSFHHAQLQYQG